MALFERKIEPLIRARLFKQRAILLFGPRQAGKTTLSKKIVASFGNKGVYFNCELVTVRQALVLGRPELLRTLVGEKKVVVLDEAQTVQDIGSILKAFIDTYPEVQIMATGSSSFDLANKINEPLTGRAFEFFLFPLSLEELRSTYPGISQKQWHEWLRLGTYPAIVSEADPKVREDLLKNLTTNYLYKDVYTFESIRNPRVFEDLVRLLALQVGSLVSINELSQTLGVSRATVEKYIRLLEQSYVIKVVRSFSRNPRTEIKKAIKIFFYDNGIRNAVIDNITSLDQRGDQGALWKNFCVAERLKQAFHSGNDAKVMFWRSRRGEEVDIIEASGEGLRAYECKWGKKSVSIKAPAAFVKKYPDARFDILTPDAVF